VAPLACRPGQGDGGGWCCRNTYFGQVLLAKIGLADLTASGNLVHIDGVME